MIGILIAIGTVLAAVSILPGFWSGFAGFLRKALEVVSKFFVGAKTFLQRLGNHIVEIIKSYSYNEDRNRWTVNEKTREVPPDEVENEIPEDIRARVKYDQKQHDVTEPVELKLKESA